MELCERIKNKLINEAEKDYKDFSSKLIPNVDNILGVRLPKLRKIAKEIYSTGNYETFLKFNDTEFMEEVMLQGMVIGLVKGTPEENLELIKNFVPKIDNWSVCDCFCNSLKFVEKNKNLVWEFIQPYFKSDKEFDIRFAYVILLCYFIEENYIDRVLKLIDEFNDDRYYSRMGVAWAVSICYIKYPKQTEKYLQVSKLDDWTYNKSIQKICESLRIDKQTKLKLKNLKR